MKPPIVTELTSPAAHKTRSTSAIVQSMVASSPSGRIMFHATRRFSGRSLTPRHLLERAFVTDPERDRPIGF